MATTFRQPDLFEAVCGAFVSRPEGINTQALYATVCDRVNADRSSRTAIGQTQGMRSPVERSIRWVQQTLKKLGVIESIPDRRGHWRLTRQGKEKLTPSSPGVVTIACSTQFGLALWGRHEDVFGRLDEPITLCLTSPPYPLQKARDYGGPTREQYVDFICTALEPIVRNLRGGGSIVLNISNDIFESKSPARSLYRERLVIALHERLGLHKMDELIWENPCKPPGPTYWSSINRFHLTATWEPVLWFTNDPNATLADNRRVLVPHKLAQRSLVLKGGANRSASYGDGAYTLRARSYSADTSGAIPRNILRFPHNCPDKSRLVAIAKSNDLPVHGATMPLGLAEFLVRYLSDVGDLVVDPFAGWFTTAKAAENNLRRWIACEVMGEYASIAGARLAQVGSAK